VREPWGDTHPRDSRWILNALEADPDVSRFRVHEIA
jgi:hypothetical protein